MVCWMNSRSNEPNREDNRAQYTGFQSIINAALGKYRSKGFRLMEINDYTLMLYFCDEVVGVLSQGGATIPVIHKACQEHLESLSAS